LINRDCRPRDDLGQYAISFCQQPLVAFCGSLRHTKYEWAAGMITTIATEMSRIASGITASRLFPGRERARRESRNGVACRRRRNGVAEIA
jgi:hypothetical protein